MGSRPKMPKLPASPAATPDLASQAIRDATAAERRRQLASSGRKSSFLTGATGDSSFISTAVKSMLGS